MAMPGYSSEPYQSGYLDVGDGHSLWYEVSGQRRADSSSGVKSIVFLHGGPGGGFSKKDRCFFDPDVYQIILFDQRGAGKSRPSASIEHNTTWDLVRDIERLREHLHVDTWVVFGGSWGSSLALAYAETHPERVKGLIVRGIFTLRESELNWFYEPGGAQNIYPDAFEAYANAITPDEMAAHGGPGRSLIKAYHAILNGSDASRAIEAARAWAIWELSTSKLIANKEDIERAAKDDWALAFARIENHYFVNRGWLSPDSQLIDQAHRLQEHKIPMIIVQGRYDMVCPAKTAWDLYKACPWAELHWIPDAGHSSWEKATTEALIKAADRCRSL